METTSGVNTDTPQPEPAVPAGVQAAWAVAGFPGELRAASYLVGELAAVEAALYREIPLAPHPLWLDEAFDGLDAANRSMVMSMLRSFDLDVLVVGPGHLVNVAAVPLAAIYQVIRAPEPLPGASLTLALWSGNSLEHLTYSFTHGGHCWFC